MRLACNLTEIRESAGKSLRGLAAISGIDASSLSRIERGMQLPTDEQVEPLEAAYGCSLLDVYDRITLLAIQSDEPKRVIVSLPRAAS